MSALSLFSLTVFNNQGKNYLFLTCLRLYRVLIILCEDEEGQEEEEGMRDEDEEAREEEA